MWSRGRRALKLLVPLGLAIGLAGGATYAAFFATTSNAGNSLTAHPDWTAPSASGSVIMRNGGNVPGYIRQGAQYYVYAAITDSGNPPSGVASVTADVSSITTGQTAAPLTAGSWTVGGVAYNYRSALLTANAALAAGAKVYSLAMTDVRLNSATQGGFVVTVDNTRPTGLDIQTANYAFAVGHAETGDTITFTFSETMDPSTIMAGWDGSATSVTVRINNNFFADTLQVRNGNTTLPFGTISLAGNYATNRVDFTGSTMVQSGASITITLGIPDRPTRLVTETDTGTMRWTPSTTPMDLAGNACMNTAVNESGAADVEF
ncbi:MAG TPA: hypothetical protein VF382_07430 [Actinomycetota bacterium]